MTNEVVLQSTLQLINPLNFHLSTLNFHLLTRRYQLSFVQALVTSSNQLLASGKAAFNFHQFAVGFPNADGAFGGGQSAIAAFYHYKYILALFVGLYHINGHYYGIGRIVIPNLHDRNLVGL